MSYKRNQIEEAIARLFDPKSEAVPVDPRDAHQARLLPALYRSLGRSVPRVKRPRASQLMHFSTSTPLGCVLDILLSEYDAFALLKLPQIDGPWAAERLRSFDHANNPRRV